MTVEEAVKILNRNKHRGRAAWSGTFGTYGHFHLQDDGNLLSHFEGFAIAEAYLKEENQTTNSTIDALQGSVDRFWQKNKETNERINHLVEMHGILEKRIRDLERLKTPPLGPPTLPPPTATGAQPTIPEMIKAVEAKVDRLISHHFPKRVSELQMGQQSPPRDTQWGK